MKKNLLYVLALMASVMFFTGCSDDDDNSWKEIPSTEIKGENATLTVNGQAVAGSIQLQAKNGEQGVLKLNNIVNGYDNVDIDVALVKQPDESFNFSGEKVLSNATTKAIDMAVTTTVKVNGNVTMAGKAKVEIATEFAGGITGTWYLTDSITQSENSDIENSPLYFVWNAPGHYVNGEGSALSSSQLASIAQLVLVPILSDVLNQVDFAADGNITAKYYSGTKFSMDWIMGHMAQIVPSKDKAWIDSPSGLVNWYVKDNKLYVIPNIGNIIAQVMKDSGKSDMGNLDLTSILDSLKGMSGKDIKALLSGLLPKDLPLDLTKISDAKMEEMVGWLTTGIPLNYKAKDITLKNAKTLTGLYVYVDKDFVDPFMPLLFPLLPQLDKMMQESAPDLYPLLPFMTGISSLTDIEKIWKDTDKFEIGIELADKSFK